MVASPGPAAPTHWVAQPPVWTPLAGPQASDTRAVDQTALSKIRWGALISIVGAGLGVAVPLTLSGTGYYAFRLPASGMAVPFSQTAIELVLGFALIGLALSMVSLWFYREGFLALRSVDSRFQSSPTYALVAIIGLFGVWLGLILLLAALLQLLSCAGTAVAIPATCIPLGPLFGGVGLLLVGAILLLIGYIGTLVAIWRLGTRYGDSLFQVGAVLIIIPFLNIVGSILVLVAASRTETQLRQRIPSAFAPAVAYPPPPPRQ